MTEGTSFTSSLGGMIGDALNDEELEGLRRKAWTEQGLLIVHPWNRNLTPLEARLIRQIAERLYGGEQP